MNIYYVTYLSISINYLINKTQRVLQRIPYIPTMKTSFFSLPIHSFLHLFCDANSFNSPKKRTFRKTL